MPKTSPQVDRYIGEAADFARPILEKIRKLFHKGCPELEESMKWSFPHFDYKGILGAMSAFKNHVGFHFWKGKLIDDPTGTMKGVGKTSMGHFKVTDVSELPPDKVLLAMIKQAKQLNDDEVKVPTAPKRKLPKEVEVPADLQQRLLKNKAAKATFEAFSPSHKREYVEWINEAKQEATRQRRLESAIEMMEEGKSKNWKYQRKS